MSSLNPLTKLQKQTTWRSLMLRIAIHVPRMILIVMVAVLGTLVVGTVSVAGAALLTGPVITAGSVTKTDTLNDLDADNKADPGETIDYTVVIPNAGTVPGTDDALNVQFSDIIDPNTTLTGTAHASPIAFNDTYNWVGNTQLDTSARSLPSVIANDVAITDTFSLTPITNGPTTAGGTVTLLANGHFTYTPQLGDTAVADTFTYTITNDTDGTLVGTGTVTINLTGRVWYLVAGGTGDGRSNTPSGDPAAMSTAANLSTDFFYVFSNASPLNGPFTLDTGQQLLGQGVSLTVSSILLFNSGAAPVIGNPSGDAITLNSTNGTNTVSGFTIGNVSSDGIFGNAFGTLTVSSVAINTTGQALNLTNGAIAGAGFTATTSSGATNVSLDTITGTLALGGSGTLSSSTAGNPAFDVNGGTVTVTYGGNMSKSTTGALVDVSGGHGTGTITFTGTLNATGGTGLQFDNADGTYNFNGTNTLNGGDAGIDILTGSAGTFNFSSNTTITSPSGIAFNVTVTANPTVTYNGSITQNSAQRVVNIDGTTGNTITFNTGTITGGASSTGININNANGNVNFANMTLGTSGSRITNQAVTITNGTGTYSLGVVSIFTNNVGGIVASGANGTINSTSGTVDAGNGSAINIDGPAGVTTLGMTLTRVDSDDAGGSATGIILQDTNGSFTVNGDGSNTTRGGNSSGGVISGKSGGDGSTGTGNGVYLNNASGVTLRRMTINGTNQNHGIRGVNVSNFILAYSTVSGTNGTDAATDEGSVNFDNLTGTAAITGCIIEGGYEDNLNVVNTSGTLDRLVITDSTFGFNNTANGNNNILLESQNAGTVFKYTLQSSLIRGARADWLNAQPASGGTMDAIIGGGSPALGNTFSNLSPDNHPGAAPNGNRIVLQANGTSTFNISNNILKGSLGSAIATNALSATALTNGTIQSNTIGIAGTANSGSTSASAISVQSGAGGDVTLLIDNNDIFQYNNHGILFTLGDQMGNPAPTIQATITNNVVNTPGSLLTNFNGFHLNNGIVSTDNFTSCFDIHDNNFSSSGKGPGASPNSDDVRLRHRQGTTIQLPGYTGPARDNGDLIVSEVTTYLAGRPNSFGTGTANSVSTGGGFTNTPGGAPCTAPIAMQPSNNTVANAQPFSAASVSQAPATLNTVVAVGARASVAKTFTIASGSVKLSKQTVWAKAPATVTTAGGGSPRLFAVRPVPLQSGETVTVPAFTLPANKTVTIKFRVTVDALDPGEIRTRILNQGNVTFTGGPGGGVNTTDPTPNSDAACLAAPSIGTKTCTPVDRPDTTVTSIARASGNPTKNTTVTWQVVFANSINGLAPSNFTLVNTGLGGTPVISSVTETSGPPSTTWNVTATGYTGNGTLELRMANDTGLSHDVTNQPYTQPTSGAVFTIDTIPPTVTGVSSNSNTGCLTVSTIDYCNASDVVNIQIAFNEVVNVDTTGGTPTLTLNLDGTDRDATYNSGSGTNTLTFVYTVQAGDNTDPAAPPPNELDYVSTSSLSLNGGTIQDAATNDATLTLASPGASGSLGFNENIVIDTVAPVATNFNRSVPASTPTNANSLTWQVIFSENISEAANNVDGTDFTVPALTGEAINTTGSGDTYDVTVSGGNIANFNGLVDLDFAASPTIADLAGNLLTNTVVGFDQHYVLDNTAPTVTINQKTSAPAQADPTGTSPINFTVVFNESVGTSFVTGDVNLSTSTAPGTLVGTVTEIAPMDGTTYNVAVTGMTGDGDVIASINAGVASDTAGNTNAASTSTDNTVTYDITQPTVTINQKTSAPAQADPTGSSPINFTVVFSEPVSDFDDAADVTLTGTAGADTILITGGPTTYNVAVSGMTGDGTVIADVPAGAATDGLNLSAASTSTDNSVLYDTVAPSVTVNQKTSAPAQADPTSTDPINFTVTFSEDVTGFTNPATDVTISGTAASGTSAVITGGPKVYNVAISGMSVNGTIIVDVPAGAAFDLASQPNDASTSTDHTVTFIPPADLSITKTDGVTTAIPGGSVTYTITASNAGPNAAPAAIVADTFPASLTANWTCVGAGGGTCTASGSGNINDTVNLPVGGSVTYTASATINAAATGTLANTATVSAGSGVFDETPANNSATDTDTLTPQADLAITKTDGVTTAVPGGSVTYTITASNAGPSNVPVATVADTFPASLTVTWTCVGAGGGTCTASGSGNINDTTVNLPVGGSVTYTASATISPAATGTLSNTAAISSAVTDPVPGNNSATDTDTLTPQADLSITKTDGVTVVIPGGSTTYTIVASNAGLSNAPGATVADTFPASLTVTWTCVGAGGGTCTASGSGNISDTVNLPAGGSVTYTASATISMSASGTISNTATVAAPGGVTDPSPANNSATDNDTVVPPVSVTINQKTSAPAQADPTNATSINFTVVFGSAVTDFDDASDVTLSGTAGATTVVITGGPTTYNVAVSGMTGNGTVIADIPAAVAVGGLGQPNAASTSTDNVVTYDGTPPDTNITSMPANPTTSTSATFGFDSPDVDAVFECQLDGGGFSGCSSPRSYTVAEGSHTFQVRAVDPVGNVDPTPASFTWVVDLTAPNTIIDTTPTDPSNSSTANFTFHGTDGTGSGIGSVECKLDSGSFTACTTPTSQSYTGLSEGSHTVQVRAIDNAGNVDASPDSYTWVVDTIAPNTTILTNPTNPTATSSANFTFSGTDTGGTGVVGFQCQLDGGGYSACNSGSKSYVILSDGSHTFDVRAVDAAGNADGTPASYTWVLDTTPPNTTITSTNGLGVLTNSTSATFDFTGDDGTGVGGLTFQCKLDSGSFTTCTSPQNYSSLANGSHTFQVRAIDSLGNVDATPDGFSWTVDTVGPTVVVSSVTTSPTNISPITVTITFSESVTGFTPSVASGDIVIGGVGGTDSNPTGSGTTYSFDLTPSGQGAVTVSVPAGSAVDGATNPNAVSNTFSITYDNVAPTVTINQKTSAPAQADPTSISPIKFTVIFSEAVTGFTSADVALSGTAGATTSVVTGSGTTYTVSVSGMTASGTVIADVSANAAQDAAGNDSTLSTSTDNNVTFNNTPLTVTINQAAGQTDPDFADSASKKIHFTAVFSEPVTGFTASDISFAGTTLMGTLTASVTQIAPMDGTTYDVGVRGMLPKGTVFVNIPVNKATSIARGVGNQASTSTDNNIIVDYVLVEFTSTDSKDGWVLESSETSGVGGSLDSTATTSKVGDDANDKQYRSILDFATGSLPDSAVFFSVNLRIIEHSITGTNPFTTHGLLKSDIKSNFFSTAGALQNPDFEDTADKSACNFETVPEILESIGTAYRCIIFESAYPHINVTGSTQFRLRFATDDNDDMSADTFNFYSGDYGGLSQRPRLFIKYYITPAP